MRFVGELISRMRGYIRFVSVRSRSVEELFTNTLFVYYGVNEVFILWTVFLIGKRLTVLFGHYGSFFDFSGL